MKRILVSFMMVFALVSCSTEELSNGGNTPASNKGGVQLVLSTDGFNEVGSRAVDESVIHDVNILQYVDGALRPVIYLDEENADFSKAVEVSGLEKADATFMDDATDADGNKVKVMQENGKEHFIFIIANYGSKIDREQVHDLASLKKFTMSFSGKTTMENLPMTGFYYGGINPTSTTQMKVTLQRAVAKINFTLDTSAFRINGKTPSALFVNSIKLCNVPGNITLYPCKVRPSLPKDDITAGKWNFGEQTPSSLFPTKEEMEATGGSVTYGDDENQSSTANTYVAYIPENARGSYDGITDNVDKRPSKCDNSISEEDEKTEKSYTYILVDLNYVINGTAKNVTYKFYLGGNSTGDMNLLRNTQYNITTRLRGANEADTRISISNIEPSGTVLAAANCYMIDMGDVTNENNQFIIPLSQVNKGWEKIAEYDATQSSTKTKVADMIKSGKWTIKTLWKTWEGPTNVKGTTAAGSTVDNPIAKLNIPASVKNGNNAVVELVSTEDNNIYWSWHLWFTDYKPNKSTDAERKGQVHQYPSPIFLTGIYKGRYMMDRDLGATATDVKGAIDPPESIDEAIKYYGLRYVFGRKDPFIRSSDGTTKFLAVYDADGTLYNDVKNAATPPFKVEAGSASLAKATMNPFTFYTSSGNWTGVTSGLWSELNGATEVEKSPFDPCPPGWRVPVYGTWDSFTNNLTWYRTAYGTGGFTYTGNNIQTWYPVVGALLYTDGTLNFMDSNSAWWSATPANSSNSYYWDSQINRYIQYVNGPRAYGLSVRCVQDRE